MRNWSFDMWMGWGFLALSLIDAIFDRPLIIQATLLIIAKLCFMHGDIKKERSNANPN